MTAHRCGTIYARPGWVPPAGYRWGAHGAEGAGYYLLREADDAHCVVMERTAGASHTGPTSAEIAAALADCAAGGAR